MYFINGNYFLSEVDITDQMDFEWEEREDDIPFYVHMIGILPVTQLDLWPESVNICP